jgi:hypothetical protein
MGSIDRGQEIIADLESVGLRATSDPSAIAPPCILVAPPNHTFDVACGSSVVWQLVALATSTTSADRTSWGQLDGLIDLAVTVLDIESATLVSYMVNGKSYPAYILSFREAIS